MVNQKNLIYGRDAATGELLPYRYNRGALDVYIQDQTTPIVNWLVHQDLNAITLASNTVIDSRIINLNAGHNVVTGNIIVLLQSTHYYQGTVTNVNVNQITLDTPLDTVFRSDRAYEAYRATANMNVNGNVTRQLFHVQPAPANKWDITQLVVYMVDNAAMDDTTFAGISAISNGIVLRKKNTVYENIGNAKSNGDFKAFGCEVTYATKVGGGEFSMVAVCQFGGQGNAGVTVRVDGTIGEEIEVIVQDDLSAITRISASVIGHIVE